MTPAQLATLKAAIIADPTAGPIRAAGDTASLGAWCNGASSTLAWRTSVPAQDSDEAATYTTYDSLVQGKRDSWAIFLMFSRNFTKAKIRNWIVDVWGAATASSIAEAILQSGTEFATNAQVALGGTTRTTGTVSALSRTWAEQVSVEELSKLVN